MLDIGGKGFPRVKQFDMEERKTMIFNAKARTIGVSQTGMHFFFLQRERRCGKQFCCRDARGFADERVLHFYCF